MDERVKPKSKQSKYSAFVKTKNIEDYAHQNIKGKYRKILFINAYKN